MSHVIEELQAQLNCDTVFTIPILGGLPVDEGVVVSWIVIAAIAIISFVLTRNLKVHNISKRQLVLETAVTGIQNIVKGFVGEEAAGYVPYLTSVLIFLGLSNMIGLIGFKPPAKDLNVTVAFAIISIVLIEFSGIHKKGPKKWLKGFSEPIAIITPINILEVFIKPLSLCMRLFGNVLAAFVIMELIKLVIPVGVPAAFSIYFDIFDGLIQAYVFVFLTGLFIKESVE